MKAALLDKKNMDALISRLLKTGAVYAPVPDGGHADFREITSAAEMGLEARNTRLSAKGVFFPQRGELMRFQGSALRSAPLPAAAFTVFGVRPCDARALTLLDRVFGPGSGGIRPFEDPYYTERRRQGLVIALACDEPGPECFCASVGGHPYGHEGADILMSAADGGWLLQAATDKGVRFWRAWARCLPPQRKQKGAPPPFARRKPWQCKRE